MQDPIETTIETYQKKFNQYVAQTDFSLGEKFKIWLELFVSLLPESGSIFEFGSATGRDARYFREKGFTVLCTDIVSEVLTDLSTDGFNTEFYNFKDSPKVEWLNSFDGVFAGGVFLHAPQDIFEQILKNISTIMKNNGIVAFSMQEGKGFEMKTNKTDTPRYFKYYSIDELKNIALKNNFEIVYMELGDDPKWIHVILRKN